jgi:hypothetical protein
MTTPRVSGACFGGALAVVALCRGMVHGSVRESCARLAFPRERFRIEYPQAIKRRPGDPGHRDRGCDITSRCQKLAARVPQDPRPRFEPESILFILSVDARDYFS